MTRYPDLKCSSRMQSLRYRDRWAEPEFSRGIRTARLPYLEFRIRNRDRAGQNPSIEIPPEQTAFLTYTSGTTGRPKGVMKTHRQLRRAAAVHTEAMQYTENDRIPLFAMVSTGQGAAGLWLLAEWRDAVPFSAKDKRYHRAGRLDH